MRFTLRKQKAKKELNYPRVALLCPPSAEESEAFGHLSKNVVDLQVAQSLTDALKLVRHMDITHFLVMSTQDEPRSDRWADALIDMRTKVQRSFAIISMAEGEDCHLLPAKPVYN